MALSYDELLKAAEDPNYIDAAKKQAENLAPVRKGLGTISPKSLLGQAAALGQYGQGGLMDAAGFTSALFNFPELSAGFKEAADEFYETGKSYGEDYGQGFYKFPEIINDSDLNEQLMALVPTAGFEGGVEQEMSTEEAMMGMPGPAGLSNAQAVQEAIIGATPAFEKSGRGDAPVKEEKFFTGEGKPKPGEMMDTDFLNTFEEALLDTGRAKGDTVTPETKEDLLEKYKKEFYEATGLDSSGKVDKSAALMALGLSLMQNKAGKGFNVGKMLSAVGEAGEAALPELTKAKATAKAEKVAAGKYALERVKSERDASAAVAASNAAFARDIYLKNLEAELEAREKGFEVPDSPYNTEINIGGKAIKIRKGIDKDTGRSVYLDAPTDSVKIAQAYRRSLEGLEAINQMRAINDLMQSSELGVGGFTGAMFLERAQGVLSSMGIGDPKELFTEAGEKIHPEFKGISLESSAEIIRRALLLRFKRFISQETGNGISNVDWKVIDESSGKYQPFKNPNEAIGSLNELERLFSDSLDTLDPVITNMLSPKSYSTSNQKNNYLHAEAVEAIENALQGVTSISSNVVDGTETYDLTK
jgi:hypothetical protein